MTAKGAPDEMDEPIEIETVEDEAAGEGVVCLRVSGEVDASTAPVLRAAIEKAVADGCTGIRLDLSGTEFFDSTGISTLLAGRTLLEGRGDLRLSAASPAVTRAITVTGLDEILAP